MYSNGFRRKSSRMIYIVEPMTYTLGTLPMTVYGVIVDQEPIRVFVLAS